MEVKIRLQRIGKNTKNNYNFRVVAISAKSPRDGRHLEQLGYYDPTKKPAVLSLEMEKINKWLDRGAILSDTVRSFLKKAKKA